MNQYIGIPFKSRGRTPEGFDCWGLLRYVYQQELGIVLPSYVYEYESAEDSKEIAPLVEKYKSVWTEVISPSPFDAVLMSIWGANTHVGVVLDNRWMLHTMKGISSCQVLYKSASWRHKIRGFYRYVG